MSALDPTEPASPEGIATQPLSHDELVAGRSRIGRYEIRGVLGRGGMGVVVAAHDPELDRLVAVKILSSTAPIEARDAAVLRREAQALAKVTHANVVGVFDSGIDGSPYLVMQLVEGETLGTYLERTKPATADVIALFLQAARGLVAIHAAGLIHRDFKPSNALVDRAGVVRVSDLGLARIGELANDGQTRAHLASTIAGTPAYMAPEQVAGRELTAACDQYSFCVALWEALAGERPTPTPTPTPKPKPTPQPRGVTKRQLAALQRGLAVDPAARFPSMEALAAALAPARLGRGAWLIGGGGVLAVGAVATAIALSGGSPATPPPPPPPTTTPSPPPVATKAIAIADARRLTPTDTCDEYPSVAPDGTIYYDAIDGPDSHLMALAPGAKEPRILTHVRGWDLGAQVSPDGKRIAWLRKDEVAMTALVADLDDLEHPTKIAPGGGRPAWSRDGKLVYAGARKNFGRYDAHTGALVAKLAIPGDAFPMAALELDDGRVAVLTKTGVATADGVAIYAPRATTGTWLYAPNDDHPMDEVLALAPGGAALLIARLTVTNNVELWSLPLDGKTPPSIVSGAAINARKHLAIAGRRAVWSDCTEIMTLSRFVGPTKLEDLAHNKWMDFGPMAVPASDDVIFLSYRSSTDEIWRMTHGKDGAKRVPFGDIEPDRVALSPDGALLAASNDDGLFVGPLDGSSPPRLVAKHPGIEFGATFLDAKTLAFETRDGDRDRIARIAITGGEPTWLLGAGTLAPAQRPGTRELAYLEDVRGAGPLARRVMILDEATGKTRPLAAALPPYPYRDLRWSADGKRLLAIRRDGALRELDATTGTVLRTFDIGADQVLGATYAGDDVLIGRSTSAGDIWEADLAPR